ncbi:hypothetical protein JHK82_018562 [Glycine max]|nr:hypothetical protein JHK85_018991 [Glycine max]KAG5142867.1 hypothetical protein JHK82_018562 [Glycine max]
MKIANVGNVLRQSVARSTKAPVSCMLNYIRCMSSSKLFIGGFCNTMYQWSMVNPPKQTVSIFASTQSNEIKDHIFDEFNHVVGEIVEIGQWNLHDKSKKVKESTNRDGERLALDGTCSLPHMVPRNALTLAVSFKLNGSIPLHT